jgi:hypothetical protein
VGFRRFISGPGIVRHFRFGKLTLTCTPDRRRAYPSELGAWSWRSVASSVDSPSNFASSIQCCVRKNCAPTESEQLQNDEQAARWSCDYKATKIKLDEAAKRFERVQTLFTELIDLFREAEAVDQQVSGINGSAP